MKLHAQIIALFLGLNAALLTGGCASQNKPLTPEQVMAAPDARLRSIILTKIELLNAPIDDAARYLTQQSKEADPEKVGVVITYRHFGVGDAFTRVNVKMEHATVMQALEEVCRQSRCGYLVEKHRVVVLSEEYLKSLQPRKRFFSSPRL